MFVAVLIAFFATSQAAWVPQSKFLDEFFENEVRDAATAGNNAPVVKKPEIWTVEYYMEKGHIGFTLEIKRTVGCLKGSFTGKGKVHTQKDQAVTAQGTFLDGDLVMVLSCKDEGWKAVMTGKKVAGEMMIKGTHKPISSHVFFTAVKNGAEGTWIWKSDIELKGDDVKSELSMSDKKKNGVRDITGNGKDNEKDTWETTGTVDEDGKVHLTNTYPDGKQSVFDGIFVNENKMEGYMHSESMTGTFTVKM